MSELVAGVLVAAAALAFVLEPLARRAGRSPVVGAPLDPRAEALVSQLRARLASQCPSCGAPAGAGSAFCSRCGTVLLKP